MTPGRLCSVLRSPALRPRTKILEAPVKYPWLTFDSESGEFWCCPPLSASQPSLYRL